MKYSAKYIQKGFSSLVVVMGITLLVGLGIFIADKLGFTGDWRGRASNGTSYYVDCAAGSDAEGVLGTSESTAWKTIERANRATLSPGDKLLFKRGCVWTKTSAGVYLDAKWNGLSDSPITIGAYGSGALPVIQSDARSSSRNQINVDVTGSYLIVENIHTKVINHYRETLCRQSDGTGVRLGWYVGFSVNGSNNLLKHIEASQMSIGVNLTDDSRNNKVSYANIHDLNSLWRINKTIKALGALGVNLHGDDHEVEYSMFENNEAQCNYVDDGTSQEYSAPFEIYNANRAYVHHNKAFEHRKHFEMGKLPEKTSNGNVLAYNLFVSSKSDARGPNIHGSSNQFGPINNTQIYHNTFVFTGAGSQALICACDGGATVKNNIFVAERKAAYYSGNFTEGKNIYWDYQKTADNDQDPLVQIAAGSRQSSIDSSSQKLDPQFMNSTVPGGNFRLNSNSPALNAASGLLSLDLRLLSILRLDLENIEVPQANASEIGALETYVQPSPTPTPSPTATPTPTPSPAVVSSPTPIPGDEVPSINFSNPKEGDIVSRRTDVTIEVNATDDNGIADVEFFVDGDVVARDESAPYQFSWRVPSRKNTQFTLRAKATDSAGQVKNATITVTSN